MNNAGLVPGIRDVSQGRGLDIKPYGLLISEASPGRGDTRTDVDTSAGIDLFYNPTPLLRTNFTVNTDFAQTEVDQRQVNLTRFSLFFPERRDFFLDGATFFDFAQRQRTGKLRQGQGNDQVHPALLQPPNRAERRRHAAEDRLRHQGHRARPRVRTSACSTSARARTDGFTSEDFTVARSRRRLFATVVRRCGCIHAATRYDGSEPESYGRPRHVVLDVHVQGLQNLVSRPVVPARHAGGIVDAATRPSARYVAVPERPMGRTLRRHRGTGELRSRRSVSSRAAATGDSVLSWISCLVRRTIRYIRQLEFGGSLDVKTDLQNDMLARTIDFTLLQINLHSGDMGSISANRNYERLDEPFEITDDITLPLGAEYDFSRYRFWMQTANRRVLAVSMRYRCGRLLLRLARRTRLQPDGQGPPRPHRRFQRRVELGRAARGTASPRALSPESRNAVHALHRAREQRAVRLTKCGARLAVALPVDPHPRQRSLRRLYPQLAG